MTKLVVNFNGQIQREVRIDKARLHIGRRPSNDIVLDHLAVSGRHATIDTTNEGSFILDLCSTNGTSVNGQPIKKHLLQDGDIIELGKYRLQFKLEVDNYVPSPEDITKTGKIKVLNGTNAGREMTLSKSTVTLGSPGILVIAIKRDENNRFFLNFVEGKAFPKINDESMDARPRLLQSGDVIDLSGTRMEFVLS